MEGAKLGWHWRSRFSEKGLIISPFNAVLWLYLAANVIAEVGAISAGGMIVEGRWFDLGPDGGFARALKFKFPF